MAYSACDPGNYFVIPGSPEAACQANMLVPSHMNDFAIAIVGSQLLYRGLWLEHAFILQSLYPLLTEFLGSSSRLKIFILASKSMSNYSRGVEVHCFIPFNLPYFNLLSCYEKLLKDR